MRKLLNLCLAAACGLFAGTGLLRCTDAPEPLHAGAQPTEGQRIAARWSAMRYTQLQGKSPTACPPPGTTTVLVLGQSNAANMVGERLHSSGPVYERFEGRCYRASSPMLGNDGRAGSIWPLVGDLLGRPVVFITAAISGTRSRQWVDQLGPGLYLERVLAQDAGVTHVVWMQGEGDAADSTDEGTYRARVSRLLEAVRLAHPQAAVFVSQTSYCEGRQSAQVRAAQASLVNRVHRIYAGPNTDAWVSTADRYDDCHFSGAGARKVAQAWAQALLAPERRP